jgi:hypothetical protein
MNRFALRFACYLAVIAAGLEAVVLAVRAWGWELVLREGQSLERLQVSVLVMAILGVVALAFRRTSARGLHALLACGLGACLFRELDHSYLYRALDAPVKLALGALLVTTVVVLDRRRIWTELRAFLDRPACLLVVLGVALVLAWAQLLGQPGLWEALYRHISPGRRLVEEALELTGYTFILFGVLEEHLAHAPGASRLRGGT